MNTPGTNIRMSAAIKQPAMKTLFRLIQFTDSAFPVGTFSFSNGLETAAHLGVVKDAASLASYATSVARQAAFSEGVAALLAWRAAQAGDYEGVCLADERIMLFRMNAEARLMLTRMGKKMAELGVRLYGRDSMIGRWLGDISDGNTPGSYPVAQAIVASLEGLSEEELFVSHQYGVINMVLSAALRCAHISHYDAQKILFELGARVGEDYEKARVMGYENMNAFAPEMDILASLHEKGKMRMFMN